MNSDDMSKAFQALIKEEFSKIRSKIDHNKLLDLMWSNAVAADSSNAPSDLMLKLISEKRLQEECYQKRVSLRISIGSLILAALGVIVAYGSAAVAFGNLENAIQANSLVREKDLLQRQKDFSLKFYEQRMKTYANLFRLIGYEVTHKASPEKLDELDALIVSELIPWADDFVTVEVIRFGNIQRVLNGLPITSEAAKQLKDGVDFDDLQKCGLNVLNLCQRSLKVQFPEIEIDLPTYGFSMAGRDTIVPLKGVVKSPKAE